jgi:2'-5' RNA ligase
MRAFVAVDTPTPRTDGREFPRAESHVTLEFLGEIDPGRTPTIGEALARAAVGVSAFPLGLRGVGVFPNAGRPRVVWAAVDVGRAELETLHDRVDRELAGLGFAVETRRFVPHVTLFRVRSSADADLARRLLGELERVELGRGVVTELQLKESELTPRGAIHRSRVRVALSPSSGSSDLGSPGP